MHIHKMLFAEGLISGGIIQNNLRLLFTLNWSQKILGKFSFHNWLDAYSWKVSEGNVTECIQFNVAHSGLDLPVSQWQGTLRATFCILYSDK